MNLNVAKILLTPGLLLYYEIMPVQLVKKNGKAEPFHRQKIVDACKAIGAPADVAANIADETEKIARDQMSTSEVRQLVLDRLSKLKQDWVNNWLKHEQTKGKK